MIGINPRCEAKENIELTGDATKELSSKCLNVLTWKWCKFVFFEEIVDTHPQELGDKAYVIAMVEPVQKMNTFATKRVMLSNTGGSQG